MRLHDTRMWAVVIAIAFIALWCVSVGVTYTAPVDEPIAEPVKVATAPEIQTIGIIGWCLVALGFSGVAIAVFMTRKPARRRRHVRLFGTRRRSRRSFRSVYSPPKQYRPNVERRF